MTTFTENRKFSNGPKQFYFNQEPAQILNVGAQIS